MLDQAAPRPALPGEWTAAFRLIFQRLGRAECERRTENALRLLEQGAIDPAGVLVVADADRLQAALVCVALAGATGLLWPPGCTAAQPGLEDALIQYGSTWLRCRGVKLAQALLSSQERALAPPLLRNGFRFITHLRYMRLALHGRETFLSSPFSGREAGVREKHATPPLLTFTPYDGGACFHHTLEQTYEQSLDCPEVNGVRSLEEVLEGHRAQGRFDPGRWWLACQAGEPVGVLLMTELPENGAWEVSYMGIVPSARRQGLGRQLLHHALDQACAAAASEVVLSVDVRNQPAWHLYRSLGFRPGEQRLVYLAIWR